MPEPTVTRSQWPFPYVRVTHAYPREVYEGLANALEQLLEEGRFGRNIVGYDALGLGISHQHRHPLPMFCSTTMRDWLAHLFGVTPTPYMSVGAHHHLPGSQSGFIHNDFNPVWFPEAVDPTGIQLVDAAACHYKFGTGAAPRKVQVVRGVVMIYYLLNDDWYPGAGGATGLYLHKSDPRGQPAVRCPPVNNSLIAYECTPHSWHTFLHNAVSTRTSIILWIHRPYAEACRLYGEENLELWTPETLPQPSASASLPGAAGP